MSTTRPNYALTILASFAVSSLIIIVYYFFRPQPLTINEVGISPVDNTITTHTKLTGRVTKDSAPREDGNYYLQTTNRLILLEYDRDLLDYLATNVTITGELTSTLTQDPNNTPVFSVESISSQDAP